MHAMLMQNRWSGGDPFGFDSTIDVKEEGRTEKRNLMISSLISHKRRVNVVLKHFFLATILLLGSDK